VGPSVVGLPPGPWPTIAAFLVQRFPAVGEATWASRIARGEVIDEFGQAVTLQRPYQAHLRVYYYREIDDEPPIPFEEEILFQDELIVAADKPHFLPVTPGGRYLQQSLLVRLKRRLGIDDLVPMHRIDRETAGVVLFLVSPQTRGRYHGLFDGHAVHKEYQAIAPWRADLSLPRTHRSRMAPDANFMQMREVDGEANSETRLELVQHEAGLARYRLTPLTGRRHQLRVHCAALGLPILNDLIYPTLQPAGRDDPSRPLQLLASSIAFTDPVSGEQRHFRSRRALDLQAQITAMSYADRARSQG
jgi:tRNA pseudouridine32 synthase/23S rRNA pseudouridine746 synthase